MTSLARRVSILAAIAVPACLFPAWPAKAQSPAAPPGDLPKVLMAREFPSLTFNRPVCLTHAGDGSNRLFVCEQRGQIMVFENRSDVSDAKVFLDIRKNVYMRHNEEGLLALAFHPEHETNGRFFVYYSADEPRRGVLSQFTVSADDSNVADPDSEKVILEVDQPYGNHNGSTVLFGPDGYLYMSLGDGGWLGDPQNHAQNLGTLLGTVLRIDVDGAEHDRAYVIPDDNPFVSTEGARGEIWAYGLRNVWRMSFDRETGELWAGDVGQNLYEEIDLIVRGGNYGWNLREGFHAYKGEPGPAGAEFIDPVIEYPRSEGLSVTGGYVYRGSTNPGLVGAYIYADYVSGKIWALRHEDGELKAHREIYAPSSRRRYITTFGEDETGELYLCVFDRLDGRGSDEGKIYVLRQQ